MDEKKGFSIFFGSLLLIVVCNFCSFEAEKSEKEKKEETMISNYLFTLRLNTSSQVLLYPTLVFLEELVVASRIFSTDLPF